LQICLENLVEKASCRLHRKATSNNKFEGRDHLLVSRRWSDSTGNQCSLSFYDDNMLPVLLNLSVFIEGLVSFPILREIHLAKVRQFSCKNVPLPVGYCKRRFGRSYDSPDELRRPGHSWRAVAAAVSPCLSPGKPSQFSALDISAVAFCAVAWLGAVQSGLPRTYKYNTVRIVYRS
jgi:hypothetical protein